jgi:hypothetical protein
VPEVWVRAMNTLIVFRRTEPGEGSKAGGYSKCSLVILIHPEDFSHSNGIYFDTIEKESLCQVSTQPNQIKPQKQTRESEQKSAGLALSTYCHIWLENR